MELGIKFIKLYIQIIVKIIKFELVTECISWDLSKITYIICIIWLIWDKERFLNILYFLFFVKLDIFTCKCRFIKIINIFGNIIKYILYI